MDLGTTLVTTGVYNIAMGAAFSIPLPVQPMMAIATVALSDEGLELAEMVAAGVFVSGVVFLLGVTRLINVFNRWSLAASLVLASLGLHTTLLLRLLSLKTWRQSVGDSRSGISAKVL